MLNTVNYIKTAMNRLSGLLVWGVIHEITHFRPNSTCSTTFLILSIIKYQDFCCTFTPQIPLLCALMPPYQCSLFE